MAIEANPNKYLRRAIATALTTATGFPAFDEMVPPDYEPQPKTFILIHCPIKVPFGVSKVHHEWECDVQIDIVDIQEKGYVGSAVVDDLEDLVIQAMEALSVPEFDMKKNRFVDSRPLNVVTPTETIVRRIVKYEQWFGKTKKQFVT